MLPHRLKKFGRVLSMTLMLGCAALAAGTIGFSASKAQDAAGPIVAVTGGQIQGRLLPDGGAVFKGVPYGAPPVGDMRWAETQPVVPWSGVRQADKFGAPCAQPAGRAGRQKEMADRASEDCLFLNVYTPPKAESGDKLATMVWLYGNDLGNNAGENFDGSKLSRHGVIAITINYRMNLFGLLGHPELQAESPHHASNNYSLLDQIAVLKWVHENIARFGGDPTKVTLFGESGGARFTGMLVASPLTAGLITRAILESDKNIPGTWPYGSPQDQAQFGIALASVLKAPATDQIKYLRSLPFPQIAAAGRDVSRKLNEMGHISYSAGIDGYVLPEDPIKVYRDHKELKIPMMVGSTALDATRVVDLEDNPQLPNDPTPEQKKAAMKNLLTIFYGKYPDLLKQALAAYGITGPDQLSNGPYYGDPYTQLGVDFNHRCGEIATVLWHSEIAPAYQFEFTRASKGHPPMHGSEVRYVFDSLGDEESDPMASKVSDQMEVYWTNFAKTGNPNGPGVPNWPKYDGVGKAYMDIADNGAVVKRDMQPAACKPYIAKFTRDPLAMNNGHFRLAPGYIN